MLADYLKLLRPAHWIKNVIVFGGLIFGGLAREPHSALLAFYAFAVFCALASLVYVVNDIFDREQDKQHPLKRNRPIASGAVSPAGAWALASALAVAALFGSLALGQSFAIVAAAYIVLSFLYTLILKRYVIIDVMIIAIGFVLRAWAGAVAIDVRFDTGLFVCTFLLALFLGFGKRRHELILLGKETASSHRLSLKSYSAYFLDQLMGIVTASVVVVYIMYVISPDVETKLGSEYLWTTTPFVLYGVFRYLYLVHVKEGGGSPTRLLVTDIPLLVNILLWLGAVVGLMYIF